MEGRNTWHIIAVGIQKITCHLILKQQKTGMSQLLSGAQMVAILTTFLAGHLCSIFHVHPKPVSLIRENLQPLTVVRNAEFTKRVGYITNTH